MVCLEIGSIVVLDAGERARGRDVMPTPLPHSSNYCPMVEASLSTLHGPNSPMNGTVGRKASGRTYALRFSMKLGRR